MYDMPPELPEYDRAKAFNIGSDARIAGLPLSYNPYIVNTVLYKEWIRGWRDVHRYWGIFALVPVKLLPEIAV